MGLRRVIKKTRSIKEVCHFSINKEKVKSVLKKRITKQKWVKV